MMLSFLSGNLLKKRGYISTFNLLSFFPDFAAILATFFIISDLSPLFFNAGCYLLFHHGLSVF